MAKELGSYPADFEEWFLMWDSVLFMPDANVKNIPLYGHVGEIGTIPCHQHRACKALVRADTKYPPRVCPHCNADTLKEFRSQPEEAREVLWLPFH